MLTAREFLQTISKKSVISLLIITFFFLKKIAFEKQNKIYFMKIQVIYGLVNWCFPEQIKSILNYMFLDDL